MNRKRFWGYWINILGRVRNSAVASQPCPSGHITADKREIKDFPKSRQVETSFIRESLVSISGRATNDSLAKGCSKF